MPVTLSVPTLKDYDPAKSPEDNWREMRRILDEFFRNVTSRGNACWPKDGSEPAKLVSATLPAGTTAFTGRTRYDTYNAYHNGTDWYSWDEDRASWRTVMGVDSDQYRIERAAASSGALSWTSLWMLKSGGVPACRVRNSINNSIANDTDEYLTFDTEDKDTDSMHSTSANTGRITINTAGVYVFGCNWNFAVNATGARESFVRLNGSTQVARHLTAAVSGQQVNVSVASLRQFSQGDYIEAGAYQNSGAPLNLNAQSDWSPVFWATMVGL